MPAIPFNACTEVFREQAIQIPLPKIIQVLKFMLPQRLGLGNLPEIDLDIKILEMVKQCGSSPVIPPVKHLLPI